MEHLPCSVAVVDGDALSGSSLGKGNMRREGQQTSVRSGSNSSKRNSENKRASHRSPPNHLLHLQWLPHMSEVTLKPLGAQGAQVGFVATSHTPNSVDVFPCHRSNQCK